MEKVRSKISSTSSSSVKPARTRRQSRWSHLPPDILTLIAEKLSPTSDYLNFSSVCRSWRSAAGRINYPPSRRMPWLMLAEHKPNSAIRHFYDPSEERIRKLKFPEARHTRSVGSTGGWLVVITKRMDVLMLNPMSRRHAISLPPLCGLHIFDRYEGRYVWPSDRQKIDSLISKVCLSPGPPRECVAMAIYGHQKLAMARPGDRVWRNVDSEFWPFADVIYFMGAFHAVSIEGGVVVSCDVNRRSPRVVKVADPVREDYDTWSKYLVGSSGDLLQVMRFTETEMPRRRTTRFEVFRWKRPKKEWEEVRNLADRAIFLGCNSSFSISASTAAGCRPNCIYFTDDYNEGANFFGGVGSDMGVYSLEEESIVPHYKGCSVSMNSPPIWIQPNLWPATTDTTN